MEEEMKELYIEGVATHGDPEPCVGVRKGVGEASVGARAGRAMEPRNHGIRGADVVAEHPAVLAALLAEVAGLAGRARVDRDRPPGTWRRDDDGCGGRLMASTPGRLAAGVGAELAPASGGEPALADRADCHRGARAVSTIGAHRPAIVPRRAVRLGGL